MCDQYVIPPLHRIIEGLLYHYQYRHSHISHMRMDRMRYLVHQRLSFTVFIIPSSGSTLPIHCASLLSSKVYGAEFSTVVSDCTTTNDIEHELARHGFFPAYDQNVPYIAMMGLRSREVRRSDTAKDLLAGPLGHFKFVVDFSGTLDICI